MKKNQNSYGFIDSKHIRRCEYEVRREFAFNGFDNIYYQKGFQDIDRMFERVNIRGVSTEIFIKTPFLTKNSYAST